MLVAYDQGIPSAGRKSFLVARVPVGCICSVTYSHRSRLQLSTVLGLFYVREEFRGRGIGNELFRGIINGKQQHNLFLNGSSPPSRYQKQGSFSVLYGGEVQG